MISDLLKGLIHNYNCLYFFCRELDSVYFPPLPTHGKDSHNVVDAHATLSSRFMECR